MLQNSLPKISIVTPSYNQGKFIEQTILSIINQNYPNLEYIIIDGGSNDETINIIKKYEKHITYWISEKDNGQADAINKGFKKATGDIFNWINSDDYLEQESLFTIAKMYKQEVDLICGAVKNFDEEGEVNHVTNNNPISYETILAGEANWHQPGVWFNLKKISFPILEVQYQYCFDYKMMLQILSSQKCTVVYTDKILVNFRLHSQSKTGSKSDLFCKEYINILTQQIKLLSNKNLIQKADTHLSFFKRLLYCNIPISKIAENKDSIAKKFLWYIKLFTKHPKYCNNKFFWGSLKNLLK